MTAASVIRHQHAVLSVSGGTWNRLPTGRTPKQSSALLWLRPRFTSLKLLPSDERASSRRRRFFLAFGRGFLPSRFHGNATAAGPLSLHCEPALIVDPEEAPRCDSPSPRQPPAGVPHSSLSSHLSHSTFPLLLHPLKVGASMRFTLAALQLTGTPGSGLAAPPCPLARGGVTMA